MNQMLHPVSRTTIKSKQKAGQLSLAEADTTVGQKAEGEIGMTGEKNHRCTASISRQNKKYGKWRGK